MLPCKRRKHFAETGRRGNGHEHGAKWEPKLFPKWSQNGSLGGPWPKLCDFGRFREEVVFSIFLIREKSVDKSLKIKPGSSRGAPGKAWHQEANPEPVPRRGKGGGETAWDRFSEILNSEF